MIDSPRSQKLGVPAAAFASGFGILLLEISGARLLADVYGLSSIPWTAVIATVLAGLAAGNVLGGIAADRGWARVTYLFLAAGVWSIVPILGASTPEVFLRQFGFIRGSLMSATLFFLAPSIFMGAVTPVLVERHTRSIDEVGVRFGGVGAWSTLGALVGTVAASVLLLEAMPLRMVVGTVGAIFFLAAGLATATEGTGRWLAISILLVPAPVLLAWRIGSADEAVFAAQSLYASLRVVDRDWYGDVPVRELWQNGSLSSAEHRLTGEPTQQYKIIAVWLLSDRLARIDSVLVLGGAANTLPTQLIRIQPDLHLTIVEIDPMAVRIAREYFSFGRLDEGAVDMRVADARAVLRREPGSYDVVMVDAYDHLYSVPWPLVTQEAFAEVEKLMSEAGIMTLTLSTPLQGPGALFLRRVVATLRDVFPAVRVYPTRPEIDLHATQEVILIAARDEAHLPSVDWPWAEVPAEGPALRDDYAPVEFLQAVRFLHDPAWQGIQYPEEEVWRGRTDDLEERN